MIAILFRRRAQYLVHGRRHLCECGATDTISLQYGLRAVDASGRRILIKAVFASLYYGDKVAIPAASSPLPDRHNQPLRSGCGVLFVAVSQRPPVATFMVRVGGFFSF